MDARNEREQHRRRAEATGRRVEQSSEMPRRHRAEAGVKGQRRRRAENEREIDRRRIAEFESAEQRRREEKIRKINARKQQVRRQKMLIIAVFMLIVLIFTVHGCVSRASEKKVENAKKQEVLQKKETAEKKKAEEEKKAKQKEKKREEAKVIMENLQGQVETMVEGFEGDWSVYVQELDSGSEFSVNSHQLYPASLIKLYVMAATYENMDQVIEKETEYLGSEAKAEEEINRLLKNMIEISDNESYNELLKLQSPNKKIKEACAAVNSYLQDNGYEDTEVHTTLVPAYSKFQKDGLGDNVTTVEDCGKLLEAIYKGECVSEEASSNMLDFLLNQENDIKIASGVPKGTKVANKTGETSDVQHDAAIVYGEKRDFILCIMTDQIPGAGITFGNIHELTAAVYDALN